MKNRKLLLIISVVLALTMSLGGTLAYLTDTDGDVNVMIVGNVQIVQNEQQRVDQTVANSALEPFEQEQAMLPIVGNDSAKHAQEINGYALQMRNGNEVKNYIDKIVSVTNTGASDAYVRTIFAFPEAGGFNTTYNSADQWFHWNAVSDTDTTPGNGWMWGRDQKSDWPANTDNWDVLENVTIGGKVYDVYVATNKNVIAPNETTAPSLLGIYLYKTVDCEVDANGNLNYTYKDGAGKTWNLGDITNLEVRVLSQAVQASGFEDAWTALDTAFGDVNAANVQEWMTTIEAGSPGDKWPSNNPPTLVSTDAELQNAIAKGESVKLMDDIEISQCLNVAAGSDIVLDMNGHTITDNKSSGMLAWVQPDGKLTITGNGTFHKTSHSSNMIYFDGELIVMNGSFEYEPYTWKLEEDHVDCTHTKWNALNVGSIFVGRKDGQELKGNLTIYGGTFDCGVLNPEEFLSGNGEIKDKNKPVTMYPTLNNNAGKPADITVYGGTFVAANPADGDVNKPYTLYLEGQTEAGKVPTETYEIKDTTLPDGRTAYTVIYKGTLPTD